MRSTVARHCGGPAGCGPRHFLECGGLVKPSRFGACHQHNIGAALDIGEEMLEGCNPAGATASIVRTRANGDCRKATLGMHSLEFLPPPSQEPRMGRPPRIMCEVFRTASSNHRKHAAVSHELALGRLLQCSGKRALDPRDRRWPWQSVSRFSRIAGRRAFTALDARPAFAQRPALHAGDHAVPAFLLSLAEPRAQHRAAFEEPVHLSAMLACPIGVAA